MKLKDIQKQNIYKVPEGYFEELPQLIQAKISDEQKSHSHAWVYGLRYALPALVFIAIISYFTLFDQSAEQVSSEEILANVETEAIIDYLESSEISTDDLIEKIDEWDVDFEEGPTILNDMELEELNEGDINDILDEYDNTNDFL